MAFEPEPTGTSSPPAAEQLSGQTLTRNLRLRPIDLGDEQAVADVCAVFRNPGTWTHLPAARPQADAQVRDYLTGHVRSWHDHGLGWWFVWLRDPPAHGKDAVLGVGGCAMTRPDIPAWNLGYRLDPTVWGHGFASEIARVGLATAKAVAPAFPVTARALERNPASWRVLDKCGMTLVWRGDATSDDPLTTGLARRIYADRPIDSGLLDQLIALG